MPPKPRGRPPSAKTLVDRQLGRNIEHPILPAGEGFIIPNHSGDHSEGRVDTTPANDLDIPNKKYVDDEILTAWLKTLAQTGLTGNKTGSFNLTTTGLGSFDGGANIGDGSAEFQFTTLTEPQFGFTFPYMKSKGPDFDNLGFIEGGLNIIQEDAVQAQLTFSAGTNVLTKFFQFRFNDDNEIFELTLGGMANPLFKISMDTEITGDLIFVGSGSGLPYGEIFVNDNTTVTSVSNARFTQFLHFNTNGHSNLSTPDHTNDHITIIKAGVYMVDCCVNIKNDSGAAHDIEVVIAKNNNAAIFPNLRRHRTLGTGSDIGAIPLCGHLSLAVNDTIEVWITSDSASARNVIAEDVTLMITQVGG